jgi:hypothetical protein
MVDANTIVAIAKANLNKTYDSVNSAGGRGYYTSTAPELWCADFVKWVWAQSGADVSGLTPGVRSFAAYGEVKSTPAVGTRWSSASLKVASTSPLWWRSGMAPSRQSAATKGLGVPPPGRT